MFRASLKPRLVALAGPLEGTVIDLGGEPLSLGRQSSNALQLRDVAVSRRHCVVRPADGGSAVADLDSRHGTLVRA